MDDLMTEHDFEQQYWGTCVNTFDEEQKHYVYAELMELPRQHYSFVLPNISVVDLGGGPVSMMLKCQGLRSGLVVDPIEYPVWTQQRYREHRIDVLTMPAEDFGRTGFDEAWIYNCLQHTEDPERIIHNALRAAPVLRIFEWIDIPPHDGHPHELTAENLRAWIGQQSGSVYEYQRQGCYGRAFGGVFRR
jgi:hypothetical protein